MTEQLRGLLERAARMMQLKQWADWRALDDGSGWGGHCMHCGMDRDSGHRPTCHYAAILQDLQSALVGEAGDACSLCGAVGHKPGCDGEVYDADGLQRISVPIIPADPESERVIDEYIAGREWAGNEPSAFIAIDDKGREVTDVD